jgi:lauroyl/myristoyl acyltransferase
MAASALRRAAWSWQDTAFLLRLPAGLALSWSTSEASWDRFARASTRRRGRMDGGLSNLRAVLGKTVADEEIARIYQGGLAARTVRNLQFLRCHRPGGWTPTAGLAGGQHLEDALARGRGAILWVTPFAYASLLTKSTMYNHRLPLTHLSRWEHGPSRSRWGMALLNPIQRRAEDRFLRERVTIGRDQSPLPAMRRLRQCLAENRVVSITLGNEASGALEIPFLGGTAVVATGPIKLAAATGAALLLAHTVATAPDRFETTIEPAFTPGAPTAATLAHAASLVARRTLLDPEQIFWPGGLVVKARAAT